MARRKGLSDAAIASLAPSDKPNPYPDPELPGLYIRIRPTGKKTFAAVARTPSGKQVWHTIGASTLYSVKEAREKAREAIKAIKEGRDRSGPESFEAVAEAWFKGHVEAKGLISAHTFRDYLDRLIIPAWHGREFTSIRRNDVAKLLDEIVKKNSPKVADYVLAIVRMICNWYAARHENYTSPIVKGMRRSTPKARARILNDDELREVWRVAEANGTFGAFIRVALLTAQRREKVVSMKWSDLKDGKWTIQREEREKGTPPSLMLPKAALDIIYSQPCLASNDYVFAGIGDSYISGMTKRKSLFEKKLTGVAPFTIHDLRRTAKSLMSKAGVLPHISERVLGHVIGGVEGVYDHHDYGNEKEHALAALAGEIQKILAPKDSKVLKYKKVRG
jgi:integrase